MFPGGIGTSLARGGTKRPIWMIGTARGPAALALDHDRLLDRDDTYLEDTYFPDAPRHVDRVVKLLRSTRHPALPRLVDHWVARDRTINQFSAISGLDGPIHHLLTERTSGISGWRYLQGRRSHGVGLPAAVALRIVEQLADACRIAHAAGLVHGGILLYSVRVQATGRPVLEHWTDGRRLVGNVGCDSEWLWDGLCGVLGDRPPKAQPRGDVFALGAILALLVTGSPTYVKDEHNPPRTAYVPPSSRDSRHAWLDDVVGRACDPARGFKMGAAQLTMELRDLLDKHRPTLQRVRDDMDRGDLRTLAEWLACTPEPVVDPDLARDVCSAIQRHVLGALSAERAIPVFSELVLAGCAEARSLVREHARNSRSRGRAVACQLLTMLEDEPVLDLALKLEAGATQALRWATHPELVDARGTPCPHPWSSLVGEPSFDKGQHVYRTCPQCGVVGDAGAWLNNASRHAPLVAASELALPRLVAITSAGRIEMQILPIVTRLGSGDRDPLCVVGLDPADHARLLMVDQFRVAFVQGVFGSAYCDGSELRTSVVDTRSLGDALELGPVHFEVTAPGEITARAAPGVAFSATPFA